MYFYEFRKLTRLDALPITRAERECLRTREKRTGYFGTLLFILVLVAFLAFDVRGPLGVFAFPLILVGYVLLSVEGLAMILLLLFTAAVVVFVALLDVGLTEPLSKVLLISLVPVVILGSAWVGRLQFVRQTRPELRNWPS